MDADRETTAPEELDSLWDFDDPAVSEARFRSRLVGARAAADPALLVELLTQIGRAEGLQGRFGDAARTLDEAEASLRSGLEDDARPYFASAFEELSADAQLRAGEPERLERLLALSLPVQTEP